MVEHKCNNMNNTVKEVKGNITINNNLFNKYLIILSNLGNIIEHSKLISQALNMKNNFDINYWNYYIAYLNIDGNKYMLMFAHCSIIFSFIFLYILFNYIDNFLKK